MENNEMEEKIENNFPSWALPLFSAPFWTFHPRRNPIRLAAEHAGRNGWFGLNEPHIVDLPFGGKLKGRGMGWGLVEEMPEPGTTNLILAEDMKGKIFVDVGAATGYYTVLGSQKVGGGKVFSFEPRPRSFSTLEENIRLNNLENVTAKNFALGEKESII